MSKTFKIPVYWQMHSIMTIEAETLVEAIEQAMDAPLPEDGEYLDGSFEVDEERLASDYPDENVDSCEYPNTRIDYIYRDDCNYKTPFSVVLPGSLTKKQMDEIWDHSDPFYPERFGFTWLKEFPDYHEITEVEKTDEEPTEKMTAEEFYERFMRDMEEDEND